MIYLIRHGQSQWNLQRRTQGQATAPGLTDLGRGQAAAAGEAVRAELGTRRPAALYSSDLARAVETAEIIAAMFDLDPQLDSRLRERSLGQLDGLDYDQTHAAVVELDWSDPDLRIGGGESSRELYQRAATALTSYARLASPVLVVSHGDLIRAMLAVRAGLVAGEEFWADVPNGSVAVLDGEAPARWLSPLAPAVR